MDGHAALDARHHLVLDADIGEGAAHHDLMIAAPGAVGVEVRGGDVVIEEIGSRRAGPFDGAGRADMVGRDGVEEEAQHARVLDIGERRRRASRQILEIGRVPHIGGVLVPLVGLAGLGAANRLPALVALEHVRIARLEHIGRDVGADEFGDFLGGRPNVLEEDGGAVLVRANRLGREVQLHRARQRVGDAPAAARRDSSRARPD